MSDVLDFINPFSSGFLGAGGEQEVSSGSKSEKTGFAQFPGLLKDIANLGFGDVRSASSLLTNRLTSKVPSFQLDESGLFPEQRTAFNTAVKQALGSNSSDYALRGYLRPENINAIAGSAATNVLANNLGLIGQNVALAGLTGEEILQNRIDQLLKLISLYPGLMGGESVGMESSRTNFPGFFQSFGTSAGKTLGARAGTNAFSGGGGTG